jgi:hypothetical protein
MDHLLDACSAQAASALQDAGVGEEESDDDEGDENLGDDFEDTPWRPPSHEKAHEYRQAALQCLSSPRVCTGPPCPSGLLYGNLSALCLLFVLVCQGQGGV